MKCEADAFFRVLRKKFNQGDRVDWEECGKRLRSLVRKEYRLSERKHIFLKISKYFGEERKISILDFGCGGGQTVLYLRFLGYEGAYGVGIQPQKQNSEFARLLGLDTLLFVQYDSEHLPFREGVFDLVISEQVLEHVFNIENYYQEAARVLRKGGLAYLNFPHRTVPYDSHSRTWFIHFLHPAMRRPLYRLLKRDPSRYERLLNFKTRSFHKKMGAKYFSCVSDETEERLLLFDETDLSRYRGNVFMRSVLNHLIRFRLTRVFFLPLLVQFANIDLCLTK